MEKILKINYATGTLVCVDSFRAEMKGVHAVLGGGVSFSFWGQSLFEGYLQCILVGV